MMRDLLRRSAKDERGAVLILVIFVTLLFTMLGMLVLARSEHADTASTRDRNRDVALATAEAGIDKAMAWIQADQPPIECPDIHTQEMSDGREFKVCVIETASGYEISSQGTVATGRPSGSRHVRVTLEPPSALDAALFSATVVEIKNCIRIIGDVYANESVSVGNNGFVDGSVTSAGDWIHITGPTYDPAACGDKTGTAESHSVTGALWSGGYFDEGDGTGWAIKLESNAETGGDAKASVSGECDKSEQPFYEVPLTSDSHIDGTATTWGEVTPDGSSSVGDEVELTCTPAAPRQDLPPFGADPTSFGDYVENVENVDQFQTWLGNNGNELEGTFWIKEGDRVELTKQSTTSDQEVRVVGDTRIISETPIMGKKVVDDTSEKGTGCASEPDGCVFVLVSRYQQPDGSACTVNDPDSDCAIYLDNNFAVNTGDPPTCNTAVLLYAEEGPIAWKNSGDDGGAICGGIYGDPVLIKNNQTIIYDDRISQFLGFSRTAYEITHWEECPPHAALGECS